MEWIKLNKEVLKTLHNDNYTKIDSYLIRTKNNQTDIVKLAKGKLYHDFDCNNKYPINDDFLEEYKHIMLIEKPK